MLKLFHFFLFCIFIASAEAQLQIPGNSPEKKVNQTSAQHPENENEKCGFVVNQRELIQQFPGVGTEQEFESWLNLKIVQDQVNKPNFFGGQVITIPYVIHIIHDGTEVNQVGNVNGLNISTSQIESQIRIINEDFRMKNADRENSPQWDQVAADLEIEFAPALRNPKTDAPFLEPGIHRVNRREMNWEAPPFSREFINTVIKPETSVGWEFALNIWVLDIAPEANGNQIIGYAQFPSMSGLDGLSDNAGPQLTDGVVVDAQYFGSSADDDGSFVSRNNYFGRTLTHEIGHWVGLRHIWGDGGCNVDDYCEDTPRAARAHRNCQTGSNTCDDTQYGAVEDLPDMVENFMDYSNDDCVNLFTQDQYTRAETVFQFSPGRGSLIRSVYDEKINPQVGIIISDEYIDETSSEDNGCLLQDNIAKLQLYLNESLDSKKDVQVTIEIGDNTTATAGEDFLLNFDNPISFDSGLKAIQDIDLTILDDFSKEDDEVIEFLITAAQTSEGDQVEIIKKIVQLTIVDNEPKEPIVYQEYLFEDFESGLLPEGWEIVSLYGSNQWVTGNNENTGSPIEGQFGAYISDDAGNTQRFEYNINDPSASVLISPVISAENVENILLEFAWLSAGETGYDFGYLSAVNASTDLNNLEEIVEQINLHSPLFDDIFLEDQPTIMQAEVKSDDQNQLPDNYRMAFVWVNDNNTGEQPPLVIDNIRISESQQIEINEIIPGRSLLLGPNSTTHYYNPDNGKLMMSIKNPSNFDYGCVEVQIESSGTSALQLVDQCNYNYSVLERSYRILSEKINPDGESLEVTVYYHEEEIAGWEDESDIDWEQIKVIRTEQSVHDYQSSFGSAPGIISSFIGESKDLVPGIAYAFTGNFSLYNDTGITLGVPTDINIFGLETTLDQEQVEISWQTIEDDSNVEIYVVEKSSDPNFLNATVVDEIIPSGEEQYSILDLFPFPGTNYYRIRVVTKTDTCEDVFLGTESIEFAVTNATKVYPNPAINEISVLVSKESIHGANSINIYNNQGLLVLSEDVDSNPGVLRHTFDISNLASGIYYVKIMSEEGGNTAIPFIKVRQ